MVKKRLLWLVVLAVTLVLSICLAACGNKATRYSITWETDETATVKVEGSDTLPEEAKENSTITFTVELKDGYELTSVYVNDRAVAADGSGKYNIVIRGETTISVETTEIVQSVAVSTNPTKMVYYAGETLDTAGMEVEVTYATGRKAKETNYSVVYEKGNAFSLGDTSFTVKYRGVESAPVVFDSAIEVLITIDPSGGTLDEAYITTLEANTELHNVAENEGIITFSFAALSAPVALPTAEMWSRGEEGDFTFTGWSGGATEISVDTAISTVYEVQYNARLLSLESIGYVNEMVGEELVPYLVIKGTFSAAKTAYLFLYEGNDKVELKGDTIGDENTQRGDPFELKFDLRKLVEKQYVGKWMDIKFVAADGDRTETQEIIISDYPEDFVDLDQILVNGSYAYSFQTYNGALKAVYSNYFMNEYTMTASVDDKGNAVVTFNGTVDKQYAGNAACIDVELNGIHEFYGEIDENGQYTVVVNLGGYALNADGYFHFRIVKSVTDNSVVFKDGDGNLLNAGCINDDLEVMTIGLIENQGALRVANSDDTAVYYVGKGKWGGIVLRGVNEAVQMTGVTLESKDGKPWLVINGSYSDKFNETTIVEYLKADMFAEILNNADSAAGSVSGDWTGTTLTHESAEGAPATILVEANADGWKVYLDLSARNNTIGEVLFVHFSLDGATGTNLESTNIDMETKITFTEADGDKVEFSLGEFTAWGGHVVSIYVKADATATPETPETPETTETAQA